MQFFYVGDDGKREPSIVPDVLAQVAEVLDGHVARVFQSAGIPTFAFNKADFEPLPEEEPLSQCVSCQCPMLAEYIDERGVCGDCNQRSIMDALHTPPFARTAEDWKMLRELGYVEEDAYGDEGEYVN
jgi:hypothetical protein